MIRDFDIQLVLTDSHVKNLLSLLRSFHVWFCTDDKTSDFRVIGKQLPAAFASGTRMETRFLPL